MVVCLFRFLRYALHNPPWWATGPRSSGNNKKGKERKKGRKEEPAVGGEGQERKTKFEQEVARVKRKAPGSSSVASCERSGVVGQVEVPPELLLSSAREGCSPFISFEGVTVSRYFASRQNKV